MIRTIRQVAVSFFLEGIEGPPMIIIYNLSGLLLAGAGIVAGLFVAMLSGWFSLGLLTLAVIWFAGGLWWRNQEISRGVKRPFPALFFIPLPILAVPAAFVAALLFVVIEWGAHAQPADPRAELFQEDERMLDLGAATGDVQLSQKILAALQAIPVEGKNAGTWHVTTRKNGHAVLVLVKASALKSYQDAMRMALVQQIADILEADDQSKQKRIFIGIKGRLTFGAVQTPPGNLQIGSAVPRTKLYDFYDDPAGPARVALAGSQSGEKQDSLLNIPEQQTDSRDVLADAAVGAEEFRHKGANRVEGERPEKEQGPRDPEAVEPPEDKPTPGAKAHKPDADELPDDNSAPRAKPGKPDAVKSPDDKASPRARKREDAQTGKTGPASTREARMAERKKRSDERETRMAEQKKRSDETLAASKLRLAETFRQLNDLATYRKRLQQIVDKYPETEAGKKAAELLE
jgi:hypothetical protein